MVHQPAGSLYGNDGSLYSDPYPPQNNDVPPGVQQHYKSSGRITSSGSNRSSSGGRYFINKNPVFQHYGSSSKTY